MTIRELISTYPPALAGDSTVAEALQHLESTGHRTLPMIDSDRRLIGIVTDEQLESLADDTLVRSLFVGGPIFAEPQTHVFDAARLLVDHHLEILPVVEADGTYSGLLRRTEIFELLTHMLSIERPGAILEIDIPTRDYTLTRLVHTVEEHDVKILSITSEWPDLSEGIVRITLKLSVTDLARIRAVLEHHGYQIAASFNEDTTASEIQQRIREFMHYLEV